MTVRLFFLLGFFWVLNGCADSAGTQQMTFTRLQDIPAEKLQALSKKTFFFAHQSVGGNVVDGLHLLMEVNPTLKLNIVRGEKADSLSPGTFMHWQVGRNKHPQTKIDEFQSVLEAGLGDHVDTAFLKFCYVDMSKDADPQALFDQYQSSVQMLKAKYPDTTFIHFTLPLESIPTGFKASIKDLIGREIPERADNVRRNEYNRLLRKAYAGKEPLFDIARLESIDPATGEAYKFDLDGQQYEAMAPGNTSDGGHLSDSGKRWIAEQLIVFLANME